MTGRRNSLPSPNCNSWPIMATFVVALLAGYQVQVVKCQTRNEPVNVNWIFALPWDVANTLRAPLGGPVSLILSSFMAGILLFGLLLAPVNYILGYPPRIYHVYRKPGLSGIVPGIIGRSLNSDTNLGGGSGSGGAPGGNYSHYHPTNNNNDDDFYDENFDMADILVHLFQRVRSNFQLVFDRDEDYVFGQESFTGRELAVVKGELEYEPPGFLDSIFLLVPEENEICKQLMVCHAHGFLNLFPPVMMKLFKVLSKHFITIPDNYKAAIKVGLENQDECKNLYDGCPKGLFQLTRGSIGVIRQRLVHFFPDGTKDLWQYFYSAYDGRKNKRQ